MLKTGKFGGIISAASVLNPSKSKSVFRFASSTVREAAAKIGLQSLYADPEKVLEKYKEFDIVKAMKDRKDSKLLWVRARAIDANKVNSNGDYFSEEEILKETEYKGEKVPTYKTFEGVPIYSNHKNDDIEQAKGMVVYAEWDADEKCVYCTFFIDEEAYPDVARGVRQGYIHDVSMGTSVIEGECSVCGNVATTEKEWCTCLKKYKGKKHPENGKQVYEINRGLKFIELSCVGDGAFDMCEIHELYEPEEVIEFSENINKKASEIQANIALAAMFAPENLEEKYAYEDYLRQVTSTTQTVLKVAQQAGNLVGGDILELPQASQNATVNNILQFLGIDPKTGLNILDLLNLALNFLEVSVMNLFAKKDNIDLTHVSKISKAMAELQTTMQDLIDDGAIGQAPGQPAQVPNAAQPQPVGGQQPLGVPTPPAQPAPTAEINPVAAPGGVGQMIAPQGAGAPAAQGAGFGGGIQDQTQVLASTLSSLKNLKLALNQEGNQSLFNYNNIGGKIMSFINEFKHNFNQDKMIYEVESPTGERIAISSSGQVSAFIGSKQTKFSVAIDDSEAEMIETGDLKSAGNSLLKRFMKISSNLTDEETSVIQKVNELPSKVEDVVINEKLAPQRIYDNESEPEKTLEQRTRPLRKNDYSTPKEEALDKDDWTSRKGVRDEMKETLLEIARRGVDDRVLEERLEEWRDTDGKVVEKIEKIISALARTAVKNGMHPREVLAAASNLAEMGPDPISLTKTLQDNNMSAPGLEGTPEMAVADGLAEEVDDDTTPGDINATLQTLLGSFEDAAKALQNIADSLKNDEAVNPKIEDTTPEDAEQAKADLAVKADGSDPNVNPQDVQASVSSVANTMDQLNVGTDDVLGSMQGLTATAAHKMIELEKQPSAAAARRRNNKRIEYYGFNRKASKKEILRTLIGNVADYASDYGLRSKNLATTVVAMVATPNATRELVAQALSEKRNIRTAKTEITDSQLNEKVIRLTAEDLGVEVSSPDFMDTLKNKIVDILSGSGYHVDPNNFSMNEVHVSPGGEVEVKVFTKFNRTYYPESQSEPMQEGMGGPEGMPRLGPDLEHGIIESRMAKKMRLMNKYSQALGAMPPAPGGLGGAPGGAPGGGAPPAGPAPTDFMPPAGADAGPGAAALSADPDMPGTDVEPEGQSPEPSPDDVMPGVKKPWGTVCPQCQSINVEISNGEGKCNDCGAQLRYEFVVHVTPPSKSEQYKGTFDYKGMDQAESDLGAMEPPTGPIEESGLGAATAPGAEMPAAGAPAPPAGGPLPPVGGPMPGPGGAMANTNGTVRMVRVSYIADPEVFLNANLDTHSPKSPLPVGFTCPACASREVDKRGRYTFCSDCKTLSVSEVEEMISDSEKIISSISWMI